MNQNSNVTALAEADTRDRRREELAAVSFRPQGQMFQPRDGRELMDMAQMISTAGPLIKPMYRKNPGACMGLIAVCAPYGLNPIQVSWKTYQASKGDDAPISYEAQVIVAMVNASSAVQGSLRYEYEGEGADRRCRCYGTLKGDDKPVEVLTPPLSQISPKNSPLWKSDPDQQLAYYAGRAWARRYKPEMLLGIYDVDEMSEAPLGPDAARDVTPKRRTTFQSLTPTPEAAPEPEVDRVYEGEVMPDGPDGAEEAEDPSALTAEQAAEQAAAMEAYEAEQRAAMEGRDDG